MDALVAPQTVNTMPPATFDAYRDHGEPKVRIQEGIATAPERLAALAEAGIDLERVTDELEDEGVGKFATSYDELLDGIEAKRRTLGVAVAGD